MPLPLPLPLAFVAAFVAAFGAAAGFLFAIVVCGFLFTTKVAKDAARNVTFMRAADVLFSRPAGFFAYLHRQRK